MDAARFDDHFVTRAAGSEGQLAIQSNHSPINRALALECQWQFVLDRWRLRHLHQQLPKCMGRRRLSCDTPYQSEISIQ